MIENDMENVGVLDQKADPYNDVQRGARLSMAMAASGLTYNCELCYDMGVTESSLSRWRSGGPMSVSMAVRLARLLGVTVDWLVTGRSAGVADVAPAGVEEREFNEAASLFAALLPNTRRMVLDLNASLARRLPAELAGTVSTPHDRG